MRRDNWKGKYSGSAGQAAAQQEQQQASRSRTGTSRGPPVLSTTHCPCLLPVIGPCPPSPARIRAVEPLEPWRGQGWLHLQPLLDTPANHAPGAFREVCRTPSRPKPLHATVGVQQSSTPQGLSAPRCAGRGALQRHSSSHSHPDPQSHLPSVRANMAAGSWASDCVGRLTQTNSLTALAAVINRYSGAARPSAPLSILTQSKADRQDVRLAQTAR